jgi:hypothetical protein
MRVKIEKYGRTQFARVSPRSDGIYSALKRVALDISPAY